MNNMNMKQLRRVTRALVALILCAVSLPSMAQSDSPKLVVWQKNGDKVVFDLDKLPETTFGGGVLTIKTTTATVAYQLSNILRYTYENVKETGVELQPADRSIKINERGDEVVFRNLKPGSVVTLYDLRGQLLEQRKAESLSPLTISVQNRPGGVYIVKSDNETIKLMKP
jgi:hypothetical protein